MRLTEIMEKKPESTTAAEQPESRDERVLEQEHSQEIEKAVRVGRLAQEDVEAIGEAPVPKNSRMMTRIGNWARSKTFVTMMALMGAGAVEGLVPNDAEARDKAREIAWVVGAEADGALYQRQMEDYMEYQDHEQAVRQLGAMLERLEEDYDQLANRHMSMKMAEQQHTQQALARGDGEAIKRYYFGVLQLEQRMQVLEDRRMDIQKAILEHEKGQIEAEKSYRKKEHVRTGIRIGTQVISILSRKW